MHLFKQIVRFVRSTALWALLTPLAFTFAGAASNQLVLIANHDKFPVMVNDVKLAEMTAEMTAPPKKDNPFPFVYSSTVYDATMLDDIHEAMTPDTHLNFLADIFDMQAAIYSLGDFMLMLGSWLWTFAPFVWAYAVIVKLHRLDSEDEAFEHVLHGIKHH